MSYRFVIPTLINHREPWECRCSLLRKRSTLVGCLLALFAISLTVINLNGQESDVVEAAKVARQVSWLLTGFSPAGGQAASVDSVLVGQRQTVYRVSFERRMTERERPMVLARLGDRLVGTVGFAAPQLVTAVEAAGLRVRDSASALEVSQQLARLLDPGEGDIDQAPVFPWQSGTRSSVISRVSEAWRLASSSLIASGQLPPDEVLHEAPKGQWFVRMTSLVPKAPGITGYWRQTIFSFAYSSGGQLLTWSFSESREFQVGQ